MASVAQDFKRSDRVSEQILKEISLMLVRGEVRDPRLTTVHLTGIKLTDDLSSAKVFFLLEENDQNIDDVRRGFKRASGFIKKNLAKRLRMRKVPELSFLFDKDMEKGFRIDELLKGIDSEEGT